MANERTREQFAAWNSHGGEFCDEHLTGHYPFAKESLKEMTMADFVALFGPRGAFASYFTDYLAGKVDTSSSPWRWKSIAGSLDGLRQFEGAAAIRSAFFDPTTGQPQIFYDITPLGLQGNAIGVTLSSDGQQVSFSPGVDAGTRPIAFTWPAKFGTEDADVTFQPITAVDSVRTKRGPWALFHLLDAASLNPTNPQSVQATFRSAGREATFQLHVDTPFDPFDLKALRGFHCPRTL
ncbi:MAG: hypothetical protein INR64_20060 [Caulobacteraceae bacterium]|nr:hypothetical protein [Caulobacter sp.]